MTPPKPVNGQMLKVTLAIIAAIMLGGGTFLFSHTQAEGHPVGLERLRNLQQSVDHNTAILERIERKLP